MLLDAFGESPACPDQPALRALGTSSLGIAKGSESSSKYSSQGQSWCSSKLPSWLENCPNQDHHPIPIRVDCCQVCGHALTRSKATPSEFLQSGCSQEILPRMHLSSPSQQR